MNDDRSSQPPSGVKSYAGGIAARNAERAAERRANPILPNLGQAAVSYDPKQGAQTIQQIGEQQRSDAQAPEGERRPLSPDTVEGLKALHAAQVAHQPPPTTTPPVPEAAAAKPAAKTFDVDDPDLSDEDQALANALRGVNRDVIQNEAERKAVAARVKDIDLADGFLTSEFTQVVPIVPGKLTVKYRCLTTGENNELRLYLFDKLAEDPRKARFAEELLAFYQTVATTMSINTSTYNKHMTPDGPAMRMMFHREIFEEKLNIFMAFPLPLISALGTHSAWFEMRVRELFATVDAIKNG